MVARAVGCGVAVMSQHRFPEEDDPSYFDADQEQREYDRYAEDQMRQQHENEMREQNECERGEDFQR